MKTLLLLIVTLSMFAGCSVKEFKEGASDVTNDISNAFKGSKDKSSD